MVYRTSAEAIHVFNFNFHFHPLLKCKQVDEDDEEAPPVHRNLDDPDVVDHQFAFLRNAKMATSGTTLTFPNKLLGNIDIKAHRIY